MRSYDFLALFQPSPPAEVAWQIFGGDAVEAVEPLLGECISPHSMQLRSRVSSDIRMVALFVKAPAISIDVLDVQHLLVHMLTLAGDVELIFDAFGLGEGDQRLVAIHAQQYRPSIACPQAQARPRCASALPYRCLRRS